MQPINLRPSFMSIPAEGLHKPSHAEQQESLRGQVDEFASLLYAQMFRQMRESGQNEEEGEGIFGGGDTNLFMNFLDEEVGKTFVKQGGSGLRDALYRQMSQNLDKVEGQGGGR